MIHPQLPSAPRIATPACSSPRLHGRFSLHACTIVDEQYLQRALELARAGVGLASPNPYVGAVITDAGGNMVSSGTYTYAGVKHAEILALEKPAPRRVAELLHQSRTARASRTHPSLH